MVVTEEIAAATVEWAWPYALHFLARAANLVEGKPPTEEKVFAAAVVLTLSAYDGRVADEWVRDRALWFACEVVPGLLTDLLEARRMAEGLDANTLAEHLSASARWPGAPPRVLRALAVLRPDLGEVVRRRARHLGRPDPLLCHPPVHVSIELLEDHSA